LKAKGVLLVKIAMLAIIVLITTITILADYHQLVKPLLQLDFFHFCSAAGDLNLLILSPILSRDLPTIY
jgi:hypothetical protein